MMNPTGGLASLIDALGGGMDPSQAFGIVQYLEQDQQNRMAQRAERLGGLASLLTDAAGQGMGYGGAQALAEAAPGPAGPAVQNMLQSLYGDPNPMTSTPYGQPEPAGTAPLPETQSPVYTQNPQMQMAAQQQEMALQAQQAELASVDPAMTAASDAQWGQLATLLAKAKGKNIDPATAYSSIVAKNPAAAAVFSSDPGRLQGIIESIFGQAAVKYAGQPTASIG